MGRKFVGFRNDKGETKMNAYDEALALARKIKEAEEVVQRYESRLGPRGGKGWLNATDLAILICDWRRMRALLR